MFRKIIYILPLLAIFFLGCAKEENLSSSIPFALVQIDIQTQVENEFDNPYYSKMYTEPGYTGYGGVIVISNETASYLYAFDMCCPYEAPEKNVVQKINSLQVQCPKCKTIYTISNGTGKVESGPGNEKLKAYRVYIDGNYYRIRNGTNY